MFFLIQIIIVFWIIIAGILYNFKKKKYDKKFVIISALVLVISSIISNTILQFVPLPTDVVSITALGEKNDLAKLYEVKLVHLNIAGEIYNIDELLEGKWSYAKGGTHDWFWRAEGDTRQAEDTTKQIKIEVPYGLERKITFRKEEWSGFVEVEHFGEKQIIDLYSEISQDFNVTISPNTVSQMYQIKAIRLFLWTIFLATITATIIYILHLIKKFPKYKNRIILAIIIASQVLVCVHFGLEKTGYHIDEIFTYELSNGYYQPFLSKLTNFHNIWNDSEIFSDALSAQGNERFQYDSVYYNQTKDVHPPFYYFLIHTISSIFEGSYNKWIGISLNIIFFIPSCILLYKISKRLIQDEVISWLPLVLWGYSISTISSVIFIRMYVLLTFAVLLFVYIYIKYIHEKEITKKAIFYTILATYLGCMTQYYFLIFAFLITFIICLTMLIRQKYVNMFKFGLSVTAGVVLLFTTFPSAYRHIFDGGYRGEEAFENAEDLSRIIPNFMTFISDISKQMLGDKLGELIILAFLLYIFWEIFNKFICKISIKNSKNKESITLTLEWFGKKELAISLTNINFIIATLTLVVTGYIMLISLVGAYITLRYVYCILPLFCLCFIYWLSKIANKFIPKYKQQILSILTIVIVALGLRNVTPDFLYKSNEYIEVFAQENASLNAVVVYENYWSVTQYFANLTHFNSVLSVTTQNIENIANLLEETDDNLDKLILFLPNNGADEYLNQIKEQTQYKTSEQLVKGGNTTIYRLSNREL